MSDDEKEIRELIERWMAATKAGNIDSVLSLMTDDVMFLVAGAAPVGKREFRESSREQSDKSIEFDGSSNILELKIVDDHVYMINKLSVVARQPGGDQMSRSGYTLTIFRKEDGKWLLARDANLLTPDKQ